MIGHLFYFTIITGSRKAITMLCKTPILMALNSESKTSLKHSFAPQNFDYKHHTTQLNTDITEIV